MPADVGARSLTAAPSDSTLAARAAQIDTLLTDQTSRDLQKATVTDLVSAPGGIDNFALLSDGRVLLAGGNRFDIVGSGVNFSVVNRESLDSSEIWNPATGAWTAGGNMSESRTTFILVRLPGGGVLAAGGNDQKIGPARSSADIFN